ncbi:MAG: winged helix-turn-helix transcriptional regulator [Proteobacteria bacterium]|nr:winged helix-turn-helix transcriptional regulator [Pseudomonadota bacterium]
MSADKPASGRRKAGAVSDLGALNGHLGYFIRRLQIWVFQDFIRTLAPLEISPAQFSVLSVINANEGLSQAELGNTLAIERARLVRLLNRLQKRRLIERLPSSADGRRHALRLTPIGQTTLKQAMALADRHEAGLLAKLGEERYGALMEALRDPSASS